MMMVITVYKSLLHVTDPKRRQECYDALVLVGQTSHIKGFRERLLYKLYENYSVGPEFEKNKGVTTASAAQSAFRNESGSLAKELMIAQVPKHLKFVTKPEYFSEWKKLGFEDCSFLGGEILSKQIFGTSSNSEMFLNREDYQKKGPMGIWHVKL
ncbi:unnamed protein product [Ambrosiozyma monospora]|uniref:Unnamed protein product n=1 Tax=Ambrosiozyma monospora TaxID=43982 RepID=A0ACB5SXI0_AMBMO|nr:unnamed protein product [Ambrosiozyma monospora]